MAKINDPGEITGALARARTIAVVGCSPDETRPSHAIANYLLRAGFDVIPVNPAHREILGRTCYPSLADVPASVTLDVVDVFRRSEAVGSIADEAIARGARFFWMQDGVVNEEAAARLVAAGIGVAMDRCIYRDHVSVAAGAPL
ncbi:MAG TPA: CoA-binding protein [Thermoanaerobaculia bacterium]|nr:CoA-binding protein [Thermoanaerobaculia bacterium]